MEHTSALIPIVAGAVYNQIVGSLIFGPIMGKDWNESLKLDKSGDASMSKDHSKDLHSVAWKEFFINFVRAFVMTLLLRWTHSRTMIQASQLGLMLLLGVYAPLTASEILWEKRPFPLQKVKLLSGLSSTIGTACVIHWVSSFY